MKDKNMLSKKEKILHVLFEMSNGSRKTLKYEDILVKLFDLYPEDFHLRGYPQYPDTSNQSFYSLRKEGLIQIYNKFVALTEKGQHEAKETFQQKHNQLNNMSYKLSRDITNEINRIKKTDAFQLFIANRQEEVVDTDFFSYIGTTVRTDRTNFSARLNTLQDIMNSIRSDVNYKTIVNSYDYLLNKFEDLIKEKLSIGYPKRKEKRDG